MSPIDQTQQGFAVLQNAVTQNRFSRQVKWPGPEAGPGIRLGGRSIGNERAEFGPWFCCALHPRFSCSLPLKGQNRQFHGNVKGSVMTMIRRPRYSSWHSGIGREIGVANRISVRLIEPKTVAWC